MQISSRRRRVIPALAMLLSILVASMLNAGGGSKAVAASNQKPPFLILVAGDSYSAGNGGGSYSGPAGCRRSAFNYAQDFASTLRKAPNGQPTLVENTACSGDTTAAFSHNTSGRRPQIEAFNRGYNLVFLTLGGNDIFFDSIVTRCLIDATRQGQYCDDNLTRAKTLLTDGSVRRKIHDVLAMIQQNTSEGAKVVLLGYPYLESNAQFRISYCKGCLTGKSKSGYLDIGARVREIGRLGDQVQEEVVNSVNAEYQTNKFIFASTEQLFEGPPNHELTGRAVLPLPNRWMVQPIIDYKDPTNFELWYHPNVKGYAQEAAMLINDSRVPKAPPIGTSPTEAPTPTVSISPTITPSPRVAPTSVSPANCSTLAIPSNLTKVYEQAPNPFVMSSDGQVIATLSNGRFLISKDFGCSWVQNVIKPWYSMAISGDGKKLVVLGPPPTTSQIVYVSKDSGDTWTTQHAKYPICGLVPIGVAISADGKRILIVSRDHDACESVDSGATWTSHTNPFIDPIFVWKSPDLSHLLIVANDSQLTGDQGAHSATPYELMYWSTDFGKTWVQKGKTPQDPSWHPGIASSEGGKYLVTTGSDQDQIYVSSDYGATWQPKADSAKGWSSFSSSSSGQYMAAASIYGLAVSTSSDFGVTWRSQAIPVGVWAIFSSSDGHRIVGLGNQGTGSPSRIWTSEDYGNTWLLKYFPN